MDTQITPLSIFHISFFMYSIVVDTNPAKIPLLSVVITGSLVTSSMVIKTSFHTVLNLSPNPF
jgi:hypothetical protein